MLKNIAQNSAQNSVAFLDVASAMDSVELPLLQKQMVARMQVAGGQISLEELEAEGHKSTIEALKRKNLVKAKIVNDEFYYALVDDTVLAESQVEVAVGSMDAVEFREVITSFFGKCAQAKLARALGSNPTTVRKWAQGVNPVPKYVVAFLATLQFYRDRGMPMPEFVEASGQEVGAAA